jgi:uncharacterized OsmC-like protein
LATAVFTNDGKSQILIGKAAGGEVVLDRETGDGPSSIEFLLFSLGSCVIGTIRNYVVDKEVDTGEITVELTSALDDSTRIYPDIKISIGCATELSEKHRKVLYNVARACRIHKTLYNNPHIEIEISARSGQNAA